MTISDEIVNTLCTVDDAYTDLAVMIGDLEPAAEIVIDRVGLFGMGPLIEVHYSRYIFFLTLPGVFDITQEIIDMSLNSASTFFVRIDNEYYNGDEEDEEDDF